MYVLNDFLFALEPNMISMLYHDEENGEKSQPSYENPSLQEYVSNIKAEIEKYKDKWDQYKKITNKYEFINTICFIENPYINSCVCNYKPISRSYFKMIEILYHFDFSFSENIQSFHLAEGPGGFIEALQKYRKNKKDTYTGMTLIEENKDIPKWNKITQFMKYNSNIILEYGPQKDGNLYFKHNLDYIKTNHKNKYDFITADGGFDYSVDFNKQEENSINLIFCEILYALILQKQNGSFVLKLFDMFHETTLEMIYLLSYFYKQVFVYKPNTSREANSEKYIVCKGFQKKQNYDQIIEKLSQNFIDLSYQKIRKIFTFQLNSYFLSKIQEINAIYGQQQVENILSTINHIQEKTNKEKLEKIKLNNLEKCVVWCKQHNQSITQDVLQALNC